ncbi:hypothetical protein BpHYR1_010215 [Brachionus plicatilis]|uniref:Uncharacterized protein n=1 Tax=Brachionus plicatilis TaxID=10195 RepID=A0A3M7PRY6_BRAPC|nr:hypothetical protein BpHYR1_010215 [Brachionus plicatilis]
MQNMKISKIQVIFPLEEFKKQSASRPNREISKSQIYLSNRSNLYLCPKFRTPVGHKFLILGDRHQ